MHHYSGVNSNTKKQKLQKAVLEEKLKKLNLNINFNDCKFAVISKPGKGLNSNLRTKIQTEKPNKNVAKCCAQ